MTIDLNDPADFTVENLRCLIASGVDSSNSQLCVSKAGIASLINTVGFDEPDNLAFRIETWIAGNDYVGEAASQNDDWVGRLYKALENNWPNPTSTIIDLF